MALPKNIGIVVTRNLGDPIYLPNQRAVVSKYITATATSPSWQATVEIVIEDGRPVVEKVSVQRVDGGPEVSPSILRAVPVASIVRNALAIVAKPARFEDGKLRISLFPIEGEISATAEVGRYLNSQRRAPRSKDEHHKLLVEVAREYREACADPNVIRPRTHVATKLGYSSSYIGKLLCEARRTDPPLLNKALGPGKAGEVTTKKVNRG